MSAASGVHREALSKPPSRRRASRRTCLQGSPRLHLILLACPGPSLNGRCRLQHSSRPRMRMPATQSPRYGPCFGVPTAQADAESGYDRKLATSHRARRTRRPDAGHLTTAAPATLIIASTTVRRLGLDGSSLASSNHLKSSDRATASIGRQHHPEKAAASGTCPAGCRSANGAAAGQLASTSKC